MSDAPAPTILYAKDVECSSWNAINNAFEEFLARPYQWIFRGQEDASWALAPTIERAFPPKRRVEVERQTLRDFKAKAHFYTSHVPADDDTLSWLAQMRHQGVPTRLLDWTYSPHVALFFAALKQGNNDRAAVWALDFTLPREFREVLMWPDASIESVKLFEADSAREGKGLVTAALPKFEVGRMSLQQGLFLLSTKPTEPFET